MMYDIIVFEDFLFMRLHENDKLAFSKNFSPWTVFKNARFWFPKIPFTCGRKAKTGNLRFRENIRIGVGGTLIACVASVSVLFRGSKTARKMFPPPSPLSIFGLSFHFSRGYNRESRSSVFLCSETARKRLLRRLEP